MFNTLMLKGMMASNALLADDWTISGFLSALQKSVMNYVQIIVLIVGVVMVGFGIYQIAKNLISGGKGQTNWVTTFLLIIIGGTFMLGTGWNVIKDFSKGSKNTLDDFGKGEGDTDFSGESQGGTAKGQAAGSGSGSGTGGTTP